MKYFSRHVLSSCSVGGKVTQRRELYPNKLVPCVLRVRAFVEPVTSYKVLLEYYLRCTTFYEFLSVPVLTDVIESYFNIGKVILIICRTNRVLAHRKSPTHFSICPCEQWLNSGFFHFQNSVERGNVA